MINMLKKLVLCLFVLAGIFTNSGCAGNNSKNEYQDTSALPTDTKFTRFFAWGTLKNDEIAKMYQEIGVTDITVRANDKKAIELAKKYGFKVFAGMGPIGTHFQQITEDEKAYQNALFSQIPKNATEEERKRLDDEARKHRKEIQYQWGGEPLDDGIEVMPEGIACFNSPEAIEKTKKKILEIIENKDIDGIVFDYIGYVNYEGCYAGQCLNDYEEYCKKNNLADNKETRNKFYLNGIIVYYNELIDFIKSERPELETAAHIYPVFRHEPLYGNRLKLDICGQTAAWYFPWTTQKIREYTQIICKDASKFYPNAAGMPFVGFYAGSDDFPEKTPERLELELREILSAGARRVMICSVDNFCDRPKHIEVLKKYMTTSKKD